MRTELDHLVIAARSLEEGVRAIETRLGVKLQPGGQHLAMGTHNALLRLGERSYLEVIAIDPSLAAPARPRWFGLDEPALQARLAERPRLIHWVARGEDIDSAAAISPESGEILAAARGPYRWRITVPPDGRLPWEGVLPSLIQWLPDADGALHHPGAALEDRGCELLGLNLTHPAADIGSAGLVGIFRGLRLMGPVTVANGLVGIKARLRTPRGEVELD